MLPLVALDDAAGVAVLDQSPVFEPQHHIAARRKLHLGLDITTGDIVCSDLTKDDVGDPTALPELLD